MKHLADINNYNCKLYIVKDNKGNKTEIVVKFTNFDTEEEALEFATLFKLQSEFHELDEEFTVH